MQGERISRRMLAYIGAAVAAVLVIALVVWLAVRPSGDEAAPTPEPTATASPTPTPEPDPTAGEFAENDEEYDLAGLPDAEVHSVIPSLLVDDDPFGEPTGLTAQAAEDAIPVFAHPNGEPVASLPQDQRFGGTIVPVVEKQTHWLKVLLVGRQGLPGAGNPAQVTGWVRAGDVTTTENPHRVDVHLSDGRIDITTSDGDDETVEHLTDGFAWGTEATPTPEGRSFIMLNEVTSLAYTRGHPIVYLSVQSPTLEGFEGQSVAVTAFHYHDAHAGAISNGCIRLGADDITRLAELPLGTPVYVHA